MEQIQNNINQSDQKKQLCFYSFCQKYKLQMEIIM